VTRFIAPICVGLAVLVAPLSGPAHANSTCDKAYRAVTAAMEDAERLVAEMRRLVEANATAGERLEALGQELEKRREASYFLESGFAHCKPKGIASNKRRQAMMGIAAKNTQRFEVVRCQHHIVLARVLLDDGTAYENAPRGERGDIRNRFKRNYKSFLSGRDNACPPRRQVKGQTLAKIEHIALSIGARVAKLEDPNAKRTPQASFESGVKYFKRQHFQTAAEHFRVAAQNGHARAQYYLGRMHSDGWGVKKSASEALRWYNESASQGDAWGQTAMGHVYMSGAGVKKDYATAVSWYRKAASQGAPDAQAFLGAMYEEGKGVRQDHATAVKWYRLAAKQGYPKALFRLARAYQQGLGVSKDEHVARSLYERAAALGHEPSQTALAALKS